MAPDGIIEWSPVEYLTWGDFEADPHPGAYQDAMATVRYAGTWMVESHNSGDGLFFTIGSIRLVTQFVKNLSWVRPGSANAHLLDHVQGCFDLAEETRSEIEAKLEEIFRDKSYPVRGSSEEERRQYSMQDSRIVLGSLDRLHREILLARIERYESDTNYGENRQVQTKYDQRFNQRRESKSGQG